MIGTTLGIYTIVEEIGQGGMATVYRALDPRLNRPVAIKVMHPHLLRQPKAVERFVREAQTIAKLHHPHIIEIYDTSPPEAESRYLVTEFIAGQTLAELLTRTGPLPDELAALLLHDILSALAHAHEHGIVHRDLKPENVMIREDGCLKLMDFGIAHLLEGSTLTMTGAILGSPHYMSPEQIQGRHTDFRSDLFSVGSILYALLSGEAPFSGHNPHEVLKRVAEGRLDPIQERVPSVSDELARLSRRLSAPDPNARFQSAREALHALDAFLDEAEIEHPETCLLALFDDPEGYPARFTAALVPRLAQRAEAQWQAQPARALGTLNRLIALDPQNPVASRRLQDITQRTRRRLRGKALGLIAALLLIPLLALAWFVWRPASDATRLVRSLPRRTAPAQTAPLPDAPPAPSAHPAAPLTTTPEPDEPREPAHRPKPQPAPAPETLPAPATPPPAVAHPVADKGRLVVVTSPWADVYVDNVKVGSQPLDAGKSYPLEMGEHVIELRNPVCQTYRETRRLSAPGQVITIRQRLVPKPGYLRVETEPGAMVFVDGQWRGQTPLVEPIEITWNETRSTREVLVAITHEGFSAYSHSVRVKAGETLNLRVALQPREAKP